MTRKYTGAILLALIFSGRCAAQVGEIKHASSSHRSDRGNGSRSGGGVGYNFLFQVAVQQMIQWQQQRLEQRSQIPAMVSLDVMLQGAAQPSTYYIMNPRVRGNWGIFSTDFRLNYIVEESIGSPKELRTNDWQIVQLNFLTTPTVNARIGAGFSQEAFGERNRYTEWTGAFQYRPIQKRFGAFAEYRTSDARKEINGHLQYALFNKGSMHSYLTVGAMFQRYYSQVNVWGFQGGICFSFY